MTILQTPARRTERVRNLRALRHHAERIENLAAPVGLILVWELTARAGWVDERYFPMPSSIAQTLSSLAGSGELWQHTLASLQRLGLGFTIGAVPAVTLGLLMGLYKPIRAIFDPLIAATYPIPKSAILPLILLIFGLGEASKVAMVAIGAFYPIAINSMAGTREINRTHLDVGKNFGAGAWQTFTTIALPGAMPMVLTGVKLGVGLSLILVVLAEMVGARSGLGYLVYNSWQIFAVQTMYAALIVIGFLGFAFNLLLNELELVILPWKRP
jgi:ABC-type nitrate/sulfonate/bicarbonate transport system permease component